MKNKLMDCQKKIKLKEDVKEENDREDFLDNNLNTLSPFLCIHST
jgi:hypothetical protein